MTLDKFKELEDSIKKELIEAEHDHTKASNALSIASSKAVKLRADLMTIQGFMALSSQRKLFV